MLSKPIVTRQPTERGRTPTMLVAVETSDGDGDEEEGVGGGGALEDQDQQPEERAAKGLSRDVGVVMRIRAERGYGLHDVSF